MEYGTGSVRGRARLGALHVQRQDRSTSPRRCSSLSSLASECQLPMHQHQDGELVCRRLAMRLADGIRRSPRLRGSGRGPLRCDRRQWRIRRGAASSGGEEYRTAQFDRCGFADSAWAPVPCPTVSRRPSDLTHVRRQPGGARDPDAAGRQYRLRRLVATPRVSTSPMARRVSSWPDRPANRPRVTDDELRRTADPRRAASLGRARCSIANTGTSDTAHSVPRAREILSALDVDALLVATPAYVQPTQEGSVPAFQGDRRRSRIPVAAVQRAETHRGRTCCRRRWRACRA